MFGHPRAVELAAWFDGERTPGATGRHVTRCRRCRARVTEYARVRSWLRAQPFVEMGPAQRATPIDGAVRHLLVSVAGVAAALLLLVLAWLGSDASPAAPTTRGPHRMPAVTESSAAPVESAPVTSDGAAAAAEPAVPTIPPSVEATRADLATWLRSPVPLPALDQLLGSDAVALVPPVWAYPAPPLAGVPDSPVPAPVTAHRPAL